MKPTLAIVGPGKVGTALGDALEAAGYCVAARLGRDAGPADRHALTGCDVVLLTVRDGQIAEVCSELADEAALREGATVAHCSGALGSDVLAPAARLGCRVASIHPLQTFPTVEAARERIGGSWFFCEGHAGALAVLEPLIAAVGGRAVRIDPKAKPLYHAAAVVACNYLAGLIDAALTLAAAAGIEPAVARQALAPLVQATAANVMALGPDAALTGPIARGETSTVRRHLEAMGRLDRDLKRLYRAAGLWTLRPARRQASAPTEQLDAVEWLLRGGDGDIEP